MLFYLFTGIVCVIVVLAGIWSWWFENGGISGKEGKECEENSVEKENCHEKN